MLKTHYFYNVYRRRLILEQHALIDVVLALRMDYIRDHNVSIYSNIT